MKRIFQSSVFAIALRGLGAVAGLGYSILLARLLGADGAGLYYLAFTVISIATVIGRLGLDNTLLRFTSIHAASKQWETVKAVGSLGLRLAAAASLVVTALIILLAPLISTQVFREVELTKPLIFMALSIVPLALLNLNAEILKGLKHVREAMIIQGVSLPFLAALFLIVFAEPFGLSGAVIGYTVATVIVCTASFIVVTKKTPNSHQAGTTIERRELLATSWPLLVVAVMNLVIGLTDTIMLGIFMDSEAVGIYGVALRATRLSSLVLIAVNSVVASEFSALWDAKKQADLSRLARFTTLGMTGISLLIFIVFLMFPQFIMGVFGPDFSEGSRTLIILAIGQLITLGTGPVAILLMMTGHEKFHRNTVLGSAMINIILNGILIPLYGIEGAAIATAISLTVKNIVAVLFVRAKLGIKVLL